jgi:imidazolonepropionase-like amidohydrolase
MFGATLSIEEQRQMAEKGAFIEHCFLCTMPLGERLDPMKIVEAVRAVGAERCILTTDLGQDVNPPPAEGMRMMVATLLTCGLSVEEMELMIKVNPARLLGLT